MPLLISSFAVLFMVTAIRSTGALSISTYDYVVVGGGTSGLVIASRLSENPNITVAVIEAGESVYNNSDVTNISGYGLAFGTSIDWAFPTTVQAVGNRSQTMRAGKAIGGTSTINGMAYTRAQNSQINNWETIGNTGWNWETLFPYYLKSEMIQAPDPKQRASGANYNPTFHGTRGPLRVGWPEDMASGSAESLIATTMKNLNVSTVDDVNGGLMHGFNVYPKTVDTAANIRFDAARAYYWPVENRTNLHMYSNTLAERIIWSSNITTGPRATGVNATSRGISFAVIVNREVIVSAGSLRTPVLLEHSGIGNPSILSAAGVETVTNLPTVGENLQDQTNAGIAAGNKTSVSGSEGYVIYPTASDIFGNDLSSFKTQLFANLTAYAETISAFTNNVTKAVDLAKFFKLQYDLIFDGKTPMAEIIIYHSPAVNAQSWTLLPFSRGNIHITSSNTSVHPRINPNYFALEWDKNAQVATFKYIRKMLSTAPLSASVGRETNPGMALVPNNASDAVWFSWLQSKYRSNYHPIGTAAMLPRELGGVVDFNLKVYGTQNVRVMDASILPFQICGHLQSTLYAMAEKAADIIKATYE